MGGGRDPLPGVGRAAGLAAVAILSLAWAGPAAADERLIRDYLVDEVRQWSSSPVVMMTLEASNARYLGLDQAGIQALDQQWVAEREVEDQPLITAVLSSPLSSYLTRIQADSQGLFTAIFVRSEEHTSELPSLLRSSYAV